MEELKIIKKEQTNPFYDESKSNNGGRILSALL